LARSKSFLDALLDSFFLATVARAKKPRSFLADLNAEADFGVGAGFAPEFISPFAGKTMASTFLRA
jgi:hypothetical protein